MSVGGYDETLARWSQLFIVYEYFGYSRAAHLNFPEAELLARFRILHLPGSLVSRNFMMSSVIAITSGGRRVIFASI